MMFLPDNCELNKISERQNTFSLLTFSLLKMLNGHWAKNHFFIVFTYQLVYFEQNIIFNYFSFNSNIFKSKIVNKQLVS